ncbi:hypothetical protein VULLAG_LOCUS21777 [Vulpes lagopus]
MKPQDSSPAARIHVNISVELMTHTLPPFGTFSFWRRGVTTWNCFFSFASVVIMCHLVRPMSHVLSASSEILFGLGSAWIT